MGTSGHGGQGMGFVTREVKTLQPQLADNLLVGGEKTAGDGVCHGTKESTTGLRLWVCYGFLLLNCGDPGLEGARTLPEGRGCAVCHGQRKNAGNLRRAEGGLQRLGGAQT